jgi:hypothetical protein
MPNATKGANSAGLLAAHVAAADPHTQYLLVTGGRTGASGQAQEFAGGIIGPSWRPASDSTAALQLQTAAGAPVAVLDTTNKRFGIGTSAPPSILTVAGAPTVPLFGGLNSSVLIESSRPGITHHLVSPTGSAANVVLNDVYATNDTTTGRAICRLGVMATLNQGGAPALNRYWISVDQGSTPWNSPALIINSSGYIALAQTSATALLDIGASTTARASQRIRPGVAPTSPGDGDLWYPSGGRWTIRRSAATELIATGVQATGGAATAGASYGATEQLMLQKTYDALRAFGQLS